MAKLFTNIEDYYPDGSVLWFNKKRYDLDRKSVDRVREHRDEIATIAKQLFNAEMNGLNSKHPRYGVLQREAAAIIEETLKEKYGENRGDNYMDFVIDRAYAVKQKRPWGAYYMVLATLEYFGLLDKFLEDFRDQIDETIEWGAEHQRKVKAKIKAIKSQPNPVFSDYLGLDWID